MKKKLLVVIAIGGLASAGALAWAACQKGIKKTLQKAGRWHVVTINKPVDALADPDKLPAPLVRLGEAIEVRVKAAPGGKGTELAARLIGQPASYRAAHKALRRLRTALRDSKWLLETGEILRPDKPSSTRRTLTSWPLELATRMAKGGGRS